ncbi:2-dehydropantoate 2-reductase [Eoetvoesiella caeni]|uniref:2-dehydropantoate 2-reductase n=1 Tax=Eoetvoesiella caeni TaxID=645616 RepID=A0A366HKX2_9BURK|nr:2-dehydropantoate 2-reductase [Eoetvoesiella caeni]MCI2807620.1 2-dehydropantoate 2-reductase [Eoetvoesiella caeni]NYT52985.1 2-dehydropantoate 2-reductase [Eoetvoesiella caeni]RBP42962.1 ketopantoate reductase [Eoetvoesiella caeni]
MKAAIYGLGAVGGLVAARLAAAGCDVSAVAHGQTLAALQQHGLRLKIAGNTQAIPLRAEEDPASLGVQDVVFIAVKSPALPQVVERIAPLIGPHTTVVTAMNGVPWWYFEGEGVPFQGAQLQSLDPGRKLASAIPVRHILGCVVHFSSARPEAGVVEVRSGNRLILGEPDGRDSGRLRELVGLLTKGGFEAEASSNIRGDIWYKLWGNMTMNPVSAITGAETAQIISDPLLNEFCLAAMREAAQIGEKIGCPIAQSAEERSRLTLQLGSFKTSMLQDAEAGRPLEIDGLVTVMHEIGILTGVATPTINSLLGLVRVFGRAHGIY